MEEPEPLTSVPSAGRSIKFTRRFWFGTKSLVASKHYARAGRKEFRSLSAKPAGDLRHVAIARAAFQVGILPGFSRPNRRRESMVNGARRGLRSRGFGAVRPRAAHNGCPPDQSQRCGPGAGQGIDGGSPRSPARARSGHRQRCSSSR